MNFFTYIKQHIAILTVVGDYATLKRAGLYWKGHCPFHHEKTASFTVSPDKGIFYCFGCHSGGDVITFISKAEHCSTLQAAEHLVERYQLTVPPQFKREGSYNPKEKQQYYAVYACVAQWCHAMLLKNTAAMAYISNRGISRTSINYFSLGYFPGGTKAMGSLLSYAQEQQLLPSDLVQAQILSQGKSVLFSPFEERIIFPIKDHLGRPCGFGGRTFKATDERAKYYNSRESSYFVKGSLLFGLDVAKQSTQQQGKLFLVEGYTDCIAMVQHGYPNTVATLGTACTLEHLVAIARYASELFVIYDADRAGQEAVLRLTQLCWQVNLELKVVLLPSGTDPASFLLDNKSLEAYIERAADIFAFFIDSLGSSFANKSLQDKLTLTRKILDIIKKIDDPLKQDFLLHKAATTLDVPLPVLKAELTRTVRPTNRTHTNTPPPTPLASKGAEATGEGHLEKKLFVGILQDIGRIRQEPIEYSIEYMPEPLKGMLTKLWDLSKQQAPLDFTSFFDMLEAHEQIYVSQALLANPEAIPQQEFEPLMVQVQKKHWKSIVRTIQHKLTVAQELQEHAKVEKTLQDFLELKKKLLHKNLF
jgi:DNA primase